MRNMITNAKNALTYARTKAMVNGGTASIEYVLLIAVVVLAVASALVTLGSKMTASVTSATGILTEATKEATGE